MIDAAAVEFAYEDAFIEFGIETDIVNYEAVAAAANNGWQIYPSNYAGFIGRKGKAREYWSDDIDFGEWALELATRP